MNIKNKIGLKLSNIASKYNWSFDYYNFKQQYEEEHSMIISFGSSSLIDIKNGELFILTQIDLFDKNKSDLKIGFEYKLNHLAHPCYFRVGSKRLALYNNNFTDYNFHKLYKSLLNFCALDLSAFYFDIRKDVLYCDEKNSKRRTACINLLSLILDVLLKWFAPVLSFTTEEIFQILNKDKNESIHLEIFPKIPSDWRNDSLHEKWTKLKMVRQVANASIEEQREKKIIGSSLEADIKIYLSQEYLEILKNIDLPEYFITSKATCENMTERKDLFKPEKIEEIEVRVTKSTGKKCPRCWKILESPCERNNCGLNN